MKRERDVGDVSLRMKRKDGKLVNSKEEMKEAWKRHFKCFMNGSMGGWRKK